MKRVCVLFLLAVILLTIVSSPALSKDKANPIYNEAAISLNQRQIKNLEIFTKLVGYVKYFHPSNEAVKIDWEYFIINGIKEVEDVQTDEELIQKLNELFYIIAPTVKVCNKAGVDSISFAYQSYINKSYTNKSKIVLGEHKGLGLDKKELASFFKMIYGFHTSKVRKMTFKEYDLGKYAVLPDIKIPFIDTLDENIVCMVPIVILYKKNKPFAPKLSYQDNIDIPLNFSQRSVRIANVIIFWNVIQHFHPYYDDFKFKWNKPLFEALSLASEAKTKQELHRAIKRMLSNTNDGHSSASENKGGLGISIIYNKPIHFDWIENSLAVKSISGNLQNKIAVGNIVLKINGLNVDSLMQVSIKHISTGNITTKYKFAARDILYYFERSAPLNLLFIDSTGTEKTAVLDLMKKENTSSVKSESITELSKGYYHVNLREINGKEFKEKLPKLENANGIIFDIREYPSYKTHRRIFPHITKSELTSGLWLKPVIRFPNHYNIQYDTATTWKIKPLLPYLSAPKVFLIGPNAISYAESCIEIIDHYKLGTIIGENSAGTNGDMNLSATKTMLMGWTGRRVLKRNGGKFNEIGITPNIIVKPTTKGIREGRDEVLEKALEILKKQSD